MRCANVIQKIWMTNLVLHWYGICHSNTFIDAYHGCTGYCLQWVLVIYSWNAIGFRSLQYSWIIVQMFLKDETPPFHCFTIYKYNKTLGFTAFFIILTFQVFASLSDPMFIVITYIPSQETFIYEQNTKFWYHLTPGK